MTKKELRKQYKEKRNALSQQDFDQRKRQVFELLKDYILAGDFKTIHSFIGIERLREIPMEQLFDFFENNGLRIAVSKSNFEDSSMSHFWRDDKLKLKKSSWGILEPQTGIEAAVKDLDLVLVPLLAYDRSKQRLGYGKGFYDRFLAGCRPDCVCIGVSLFEEENELPELNQYDQALDLIIRPSGLLS